MLNGIDDIGTNLCLLSQCPWLSAQGTAQSGHWLYQGADPPPSFQRERKASLVSLLPLQTLNKSLESDRWKGAISSGEQQHLHGNIQTGTEFFREGTGFRRQLWMESCCRGEGGWCAEGRERSFIYLFPPRNRHLSLKQPPDVGAIKHSLDKQGTLKNKTKLTTPKDTHTHRAIINLRNENGPSSEKSRLCSSASRFPGPVSAPW